MKVVILAGGFGTRLSEYTHTIPKPMINIGGKPMLLHIMKLYAKYGFKDFYIALGYKGKIIKKFFSKNSFKWNINLIETGKKTMTGGRLKRLKKYIGKETFMMTYGDGLSNVNLKKLLKFHKKNKKIVTLTAVRPPARFGALKFKGSNVSIGAQNCHTYDGYGPYTGSISSLMLKKSGAEYIILGHSDNRKEGETNKQLKKKLELSLNQKLKVIFCIGETSKEKKNKKTFNVLKKQLESVYEQILFK